MALDRSCAGARKSGGHWHAEGCAALYSAMTAELAVLEKFVHADDDEDALVLVAVDLPDDPELGVQVGRDELPEGWDDPKGGGAALFGTAFLEKCHHLYMCVPSVVVGEGVNLVINPEHPAYDDVRLSIVRSFSFDPRMRNRPD